MPNDPNLLEALARAVREQLPETAFLKRDRGSALFVTNYDGEIDDFVQTRRGGLCALTPRPELLTRFEAASPVGAFSASLERFRGQTPEREAILLFARGAKLFGGGTDGEWSAFDRATRQTAAGALRTGRGGGVYALALLRDLLARSKMQS